MEAFAWDNRFVTGLPTVDAQHRHLVDIINLVGEMLTADHSSEDDLQTLFHQLADYARAHFAEEERLMAETAIDAQYLALHKRHHAQFVEQLVQMWRGRAGMANPAAMLHGFLASWLSFHILAEDQSMARQLAAVRAGTPAAEAWARERQTGDNNVSVLLGALHKLYHVLSLQNKELADANASLERKVAERTQELTALLKKMEEAQNQIMQSEKMAAIGQLAAGVAHEINNPVGFVNSNLGTLGHYVDQLLRLVDGYATAAEAAGLQSSPQLAAVRDEADLSFLRQDIVALLGESRDGLDRVKKIVQDLKDFSHVDEAEWQEADLNAGLESTLNVVWNELKYKTDVARDYGELPRVRCVPGQINQVFMNMLLNAAQAIDERGTITVRTAPEGSGFVRVEIADTGRGMPPEVLKHIFEPFFTTKPVGKGTGLGLSLSWDIVKKHGGRIEVDSAPGKGTIFRIVLPVAGPA